MLHSVIKNIDPNSPSAMVCVYVPESFQSKLRSLTGLSHQPDHITLFMITEDHTKVTPATWYALEDKLRNFARYRLPFTTAINGCGRFFSKSGFKNTHMIYAGVVGEEFAEIRNRIKEMLYYGFSDIPFTVPSQGYVPHITLDYISSDAPMPDLLALDEQPSLGFQVDNITLVLGGQKLKFQLGTGESQII